MYTLNRTHQQVLAVYRDARRRGIRCHARDMARVNDTLDVDLLGLLVVEEFLDRWQRGATCVEEIWHAYPELRTAPDQGLDVLGRLVWVQLWYWSPDAPEDKDDFAERCDIQERNLTESLELLEAMSPVAKESLRELIAKLMRIYRQLGPREFARVSQSLHDGPSRRSFLDVAEVAETPTPMEVRRLSANVSWILDEPIGEGGAKIVFRATESSVGRPVAVKYARNADPEIRRMFVREAVEQARLVHQNIPSVHLLDVQDASGPVLMESLVAGSTWDAWLQPGEVTQNLDLNLRVLLIVCKAAAYAHSKGLIHRDIKPANVKVTQTESGLLDQVHLLDWGLALRIREGEADVSEFPKYEYSICGTPEYWAPEMALAQPDRCKETTDVFLLGAVLYQILTGRPPYPNSGSVVLALLDALLANRADPRKLCPGVSESLCRIVERAMHDDPAARYPNADEFAAAVQRYLDRRGAELRSAELARQFRDLPPVVNESDEASNSRRRRLDELVRLAHQLEPVRESLAPHFPEEHAAWHAVVDCECDVRATVADEALALGDLATAEGQVDVLERLIPMSSRSAEDVVARRTLVRRKSLQRRLLRLAAASSALFVVVIVAATFAIANQSAKAKLARSERNATAAKLNAESARADAEEAKAARKEQERKSALARQSLTRAEIAARQSFHQSEMTYRARALQELDGAPAMQERARLMEASQKALLPVASSSRRLILGASAYSGDGRWLATADRSGAGTASAKIRLWSRFDGRQQLILAGHAEVEDSRGYSQVTALAFRPDDPRELVSIGLDGVLRVWKISREDEESLTGIETRRFPAVSGPAPTTRMYALAIEPQTAKTIERRLVVGDNLGRLTWCNLDSLREIRTVDAHQDFVNSVRYRPDGQECASSGPDGVIRFWNPSGDSVGQVTLPDRAPNDAPYEVFGLAYSPDSRQLAASAADGKIYVWELDADSRRTLRFRLPGHDYTPNPRDDSVVRAATLAYAGTRRLLTAGSDAWVREWDTETGRETHQLAGHAANSFGQHRVRLWGLSPDGEELTTFGADGLLLLWDLTRRQIRGRLAGSLAVHNELVAISAQAYCASKDAVFVASFSADAPLRIFDAGNLRERQTIVDFPTLDRLSPNQAIRGSALAVHPDGARCVAADFDGSLLFFDIATGRRVATIDKAHQAADEMSIADLAAQSLGASLRKPVRALTWRPSGKMVASLGEDRILKLHAADGKATLKSWPLPPPRLPVTPPGEAGQQQGATDFMVTQSLRQLETGVLLIDAQDKHAVVSLNERTLIVWDLETGEQVRQLVAHPGRVRAATLSRDGQRLVSGDENGIVIVWDLKQGVPERIIAIDPQANPRPVLLGQLKQSVADQISQARRGQVMSLALSPADRLLAVALGDGLISLVDMHDGRIITRVMGHENTTFGAARVYVHFTADGRLLTIGSDGALRRWDVVAWGTNGEASQPAVESDVESQQFAVSPDGDEWCAADGSRLIRRRTVGDQNLQGWSAADDGIDSIAYGRVDERPVVVLTTLRGRALVLETKSGEVMAEFKGADGQRRPQALPNAPKSLLGGLLELVARPRKLKPIDGFAVHPRRPWAATDWSDGQIDVWSLADGQPLRRDDRPIRYPINEGLDTDLAFHPHEPWLAAVGDDGRVDIWNVETGETVAENWRGPRVNGGFCFSPDGKLLAQCGIDGTIVVWTVPSGERRVFDGHSRGALMSREIQSAAYSPDGKWLATLSGDGLVRGWDAVTYGPQFVISLDSLAVIDSANGMRRYRLAFDGERRRLFAGGMNAPVRWYDLDALTAYLSRTPSQVRSEVERLTGLRLEEDEPVVVPYNRIEYVKDEAGSGPATSRP